jgi:hypothetical protein
MYDYDHRAGVRHAAKVRKHPEAVQALIDYLKTGPYKPYFRIKSSSGDRLVLIPRNLNSLVNRVEITGLSADKGKWEIFLENGSSGWGWDEYRKPPEFHSDAGANEIRWAIVEKSNTKMHLEGLLATLVKTIQRSGYVQDLIAKRVVPFEVWEASEKTRAEAAEKAKVEAEARAKADEKEEKERAERSKQEESSQAWSVVVLGRTHGYATEVDVYSDKSKAEAAAKDLGNCYVVKGTQQWNEPLGQVEEHDRDAPSKYFRGEDQGRYRDDDDDDDDEDRDD